MPWDTQNFRVTTVGISTDPVYSPVMHLTTDKGFLANVSVPTQDDGISIQLQFSLDKENWVDQGSALTASGVQNFQDTRIIYVRWEVQNTEASPTFYVYADFTVTVFADNSLSIEDKPENFVHGNASILRALEQDKAHVLFVGDSISNEGAGSFWSWPQGYMKWARPLQWESFYITGSWSEGGRGGLRAISSVNRDNNSFNTMTPSGAVDENNLPFAASFDPVNRGRVLNNFPGRDEVYYAPAFDRFPTQLYDLYAIAPDGTSGQTIGWSVYFDYLYHSDSVTSGQFGTAGYPNANWKWKEGTDAVPGNGYCPFINKDGSKMLEEGAEYTYYPVLIQNFGVAEYVVDPPTPDPAFTRQPQKFWNGSSIMDIAVDTSFSLGAFADIDPSNAHRQQGVIMAKYEGPTFTLPSAALNQSGTGIQGSNHDYRAWLRHPNERGASDPAWEGAFGTVGTELKKKGAEGLSVHWAGYGGWKIANHAYPPGDSRVPVIDNDNGTWPVYPGSFTDEGIEDTIRYLDSNIFHIFLGANDQGNGNAWIDSVLINGDSGLIDPLPAYGSVEAGIEAYIQKYIDVINRYRRAAINVGINNPKFIVVGTYENRVGGGGTAQQTRTNRARIAEGLKNHCKRTPDCVFLDLQGHLETVFDFSDLSSSNPITPYLADVIHPAQSGMDIFMKFAWSRVVDSAGNY